MKNLPKLDYKNPSLADFLTYEGLNLRLLLEYGIDVENRTILLMGEINEEMFSILDIGLSYMEQSSKKAVTLKIHSTGGVVYDVFAMIGRIRESRCKIHTKGYGTIMSSATLLLASGTGVRSISKYTRFMWHEISFSLEHDRNSTNRHVAKIADNEWKLFCQHMAEFTKKTATYWDKEGKFLDKYIKPESLIKLGVVEEVF